MPKLSTFVTLSPVTNFTAWLARERAQENSAALSEADKALFAALDDPNWWRDEETAARLQDPLMRAAAWAFLVARAASAGCRSSRWRASISAMARGSSASIGWPTPRTRRSRRRTG